MAVVDTWFAGLVETHQERIHGLCLKYLGSPDEAEDVAQETFLRAYRNRESFRHQAKPETWLYRIALNLCHDHFRKRRRQATDRLGDREVAVHDPAQKDLEKRELLDRILIAVDALPERQRLVFTLRELEGLSYQEIAEAAGCRIGTVESRLFHARKKIREKIESEGF